MLKIALKGLLARKLRTVLTGFAVVLGVAFVAGTFVFTDTIDASFKDLFERAQKGVDVTVTANVAVDQDFQAPPTMPSSVLDRVKSVPGVDAAQGNGRPAIPPPAKLYVDPGLAALVREIAAVEGEVLATPPLLLRLVEFCGFCIIAVGVAGIASALATVAA